MNEGRHHDGHEARSAHIILKGMGASPGIVRGTAIVAMSASEAEEKLSQFPRPTILVTTMTDPDWLIAMTKADGIITDQGGILSHPAIVARELGIPCVVGTRQATSVVTDGGVLILDGSTGSVSTGDPS